MQKRHQAIPLQQAAQESPTFARLTDVIRESSARLKAIHSLLPAPLRAGVQAGPLEEGCWCLLVSSNAVAAKLRQLVPALQAHLVQKGLGVTAIRIKVLNRTAHPRQAKKKARIRDQGLSIFWCRLSDSN
jgi:hypothetical protein